MCVTTKPTPLELRPKSNGQAQPQGPTIARHSQPGLSRKTPPPPAPRPRRVSARPANVAPATNKPMTAYRRRSHCNRGNDNAQCGVWESLKGLPIATIESRGRRCQTPQAAYAGIGTVSALAYLRAVEDRAVFSITINWRAHRAHAATISIGRGRSQRRHNEVRRLRS